MALEVIDLIARVDRADIDVEPFDEASRKHTSGVVCGVQNLGCRCLLLYSVNVSDSYVYLGVMWIFNSPLDQVLCTMRQT